MHFVFEKFRPLSCQLRMQYIPVIVIEPQTITSQQTRKSASNCDPDMLFLPFTCHKIV